MGDFRPVAANSPRDEDNDQKEADGGLGADGNRKYLQQWPITIFDKVRATYDDAREQRGSGIHSIDAVAYKPKGLNITLDQLVERLINELGLGYIKKKRILWWIHPTKMVERLYEPQVAKSIIDAWGTRGQDQSFRTKTSDRPCTKYYIIQGPRFERLDRRQNRYVPMRHPPMPFQMGWQEKVGEKKDGDAGCYQPMFILYWVAVLF